MLFVRPAAVRHAGPRSTCSASASEDGLWTALGSSPRRRWPCSPPACWPGRRRAPEILRGAERLGLPAPARRHRRLRASATCRSSLDELRRMQLARVQRGDDAALAVAGARRRARTVGALAVRTFERGERVHTAMLARGYDGRMPALSLAARPRRSRGSARASCPRCAIAVLVAARGWPRDALADAALARRAAGAHAPPALLVVGHGTRDADGLEEFWTLAGHVREAAGELPVGFGFIELAEPLVDAGDRRARRARAAATWSPSRSCCSPPGTSRTTGPAALARARARHPGRRASAWAATSASTRSCSTSPRTAPARRSATPTRRRPPSCSSAAARATPTRASDLYKVARLLADGRGLGLVEPAFVAASRSRACPRRSSAAGGSARRRIAVVPVPPVHRRARAAHLRAGGRVGGAAPGARGASAAAHLGPDRRLARLVLERYREALHRRRADELRPVHLPRAAAGLRGQGRARRSRSRRTATGPRAGGAARGARRARPPRRRSSSAGPRCGPRPSRRGADGTPPALDARRPRATPTRTAAPRWRASTCDVAAGRARRVLGPNGAGKTTLALAACGALEDAAGTVSRRRHRRCSGRPASEIRRRVGIVFQDPDDQLFMPTVEADVAFGPANQGLRGRGAARAGRRGAARPCASHELGDRARRTR